MAITNYSELQAEVADWLARSDVMGKMPTFIALAEARLKKDLTGVAFELDTPLTGNPLSATPRKLTLPVGFVEPIKLEIDEPNYITLLTPQTPVSMAYSNTAGRPAAWCINGDSIDLDRPVDTAYLFNFRYRWSPALSNSAPTNWLLTNYPNIYLGATLAEAYLYIKNPDGASLWDQRTAALIDGLNETLAREKNAVLMVDPSLLRRRYVGLTLLSGLPI